MCLFKKKRIRDQMGLCRLLSLTNECSVFDPVLAIQFSETKKKRHFLFFSPTIKEICLRGIKQISGMGN